MISLKEVRRIAKRSDHKWAHHVAFIVRSGVTVAVGFNKGELHAEEMAVRKLLMSEEEGSHLYSVRVRRDGRIGASKPCPRCEKVIRDAGIRAVYYHDYDGSKRRMMF